MNKEFERLKDPEWKKFGPYLSERQWGTVREDYSEMGSAWEFFPHDHARSRVYRWGEDGIGGISDEKQFICFSLAFWNGQDPILKERLFGLTGNQGNHNEDVKELYYHLDNTPSHSYMKYLYKYPHNEYPYALLEKENLNRSINDKEFEIYDTGIFNNNDFFDIQIEYAKAEPEDIFIRITIENLSSYVAPLTVLPNIWFRNIWSWSITQVKPEMYLENNRIKLEHPQAGKYTFLADGECEWLFTENETNATRLFGLPSKTPYVKDAFHEYLIDKRREAVNPENKGTKAAACYRLNFVPGESKVIYLRLKHGFSLPKDPFKNKEEIFKKCKEEAQLFYEELLKNVADLKYREIQKQALGAMLWGKQFYKFNVKEWLEGDPFQFPPPQSRKVGRNHRWSHIHNEDIISMPDKWEYPWYAAWDSAFHCIPLAHVDPQFAKDQLMLFVSSGYMSPFGQIPAYEWAFGDVNPPVHAYGTWKVYEIDKKKKGEGDLRFLEAVFVKLVRNYAWWINTKDPKGRFIFDGGFLGLDNVGAFDRGAPLKHGQWLGQVDGTCWMALYSLNMTRIALELSKINDVYEDEAIYYAINFFSIAQNVHDKELGLWNDEEGIYNDVIHEKGELNLPIPIKNIVALLPLAVVECISILEWNAAPRFHKAIELYLKENPKAKPYFKINATGDRFLTLVPDYQLNTLLNLMLDENEYFSKYGIRSLSKQYENKPFTIQINGAEHEVHYKAGESDTSNFGENSNWRGPIWFPVNYVIIDALLKLKFLTKGKNLDLHLRKEFKNKDLQDVGKEIIERLASLFIIKNGQLPIYTEMPEIINNKNLNGLLLFYEYFNGDNGNGCGASHQTGWTGLIADLIFKLYD